MFRALDRGGVKTKAHPIFLASVQRGWRPAWQVLLEQRLQAEPVRRPCTARLGRGLGCALRIDQFKFLTLPAEETPKNRR